MTKASTRDAKEPPKNGLPGGFMMDIPDATYATGQVFVLPIHIDRLKDRGFTSDEIYRLVAPRRTLARRKELRQSLSAAESDRALRLQRIADLADRVFADRQKAHRWLRKENRALDLVRPIDLLASESGALIVEQELHRIDHGMLA